MHSSHFISYGINRIVHTVDQCASNHYDAIITLPLDIQVNKRKQLTECANIVAKHQNLHRSHCQLN